LRDIVDMQRRFQMRAFHFAGTAGCGYVFRIQRGLRERSRHFHRKIDVAPIGPLMHAPSADQRVVADHAQLGIGDFAWYFVVVVKAVREIDQQMTVTFAVEGIAMQTRAQTRGKFGANVVIGQMHAVITGPCMFRRAIVTRTIALARMRIVVRRQLRSRSCRTVELRVIVRIRQAAIAGLQQHRHLVRASPAHRACPPRPCR
jgi:hypothetical protein